jgi:hypothetical protein
MGDRRFGGDIVTRVLILHESSEEFMNTLAEARLKAVKFLITQLDEVNLNSNRDLKTKAAAAILNFQPITWKIDKEK